MADTLLANTFVIFFLYQKNRARNKMTSDIANLPTKYEARETENAIYKFWEDNSFFKADNNSKKPPY